MTGIVELLLVPFHLERLHGPWRWGTPTYCGDGYSPFPLLPGVEPTVVRLAPLMDHEDLASQLPIERSGDLYEESWWRWHAHALTPFGWIHHPSAHFSGSTLTALTMILYGPASAEERLGVLVDYVESLLGPPDTSDRLEYFGYEVQSDQLTRHRWKRAWGRVTCMLEVRDMEPLLAIHFGHQAPLLWPKPG